MSYSDRAGWMVLDGNEIINSMRMASYLRRVGCLTSPISFCLPCDDLFVEVSDPPFLSVANDDAPWYDPGRLESTTFYGVGGVDIRGIATQPTTQDNGRIVRDVSFRVLLAGGDEASLSYGMGWLTAALKGSFCGGGGGCSGSQMCIAISCPRPGADDPVRTLFDVSVLDAPNVIEVHPGFGVTWWEVEFTMQARTPQLFQESRAGGVLSIVPYEGVGRIIDLPAAYARCEDPLPCGQDPNCPRPEVPIVPEPPVDACYPSDPFPGKRVLGQIESFSVSTWLDMVPVVTIRSEDQPIRNLTIRFYVNALGFPCSDLVRDVPCAACSDITVSYLPENSTTFIDGRIKRANIQCLSPTGEDTDVPTLYGPSGRMFMWPEFSCGYGLCVEVTAHESISPEATVEVSLHTRMDAALWLLWDVHRSIRLSFMRSNVPRVVSLRIVLRCFIWDRSIRSV